mmetsp:Transcript_41940/g.129992  ORF Transcript_41940/g.129992 Transcript_41940/m.129992 type:complete len:214 (+) Transcript_41940:610-1251(+)
MLAPEHPRQLQELPEANAGRAVRRDSLDARLPGRAAGQVELPQQGRLLLAGLGLPIELLEQKQQLLGVDLAALVPVDLCEELPEVLDLRVSEAGLLPLPGHEAGTAAVHKAHECIEVRAGRRGAVGLKEQLPRRVVPQRLEGLDHGGPRQPGAGIPNIPEGVEDLADLRQLLLAVEPHQPQDFPEVQAATAIGVDLSKEVVDVVEGRGVAQVP